MWGGQPQDVRGQSGIRRRRRPTLSEVRRAFLVCLVALVVAACEGEAGDTTTTSRAEPVADSTTTTNETATTIAPGRVVLDELSWPNDGRRLAAGVSHVLDLRGIRLAVTPGVDDWELLGFERSVALFGWRGPSGFRPETLDVLVLDIGDQGVEAAWTRIESLVGESLSAVGESLTWVDEGTAAVGGKSAEWREVRIPDARSFFDNPTMVALSPVGRAVLWANTTARVFVVSVDDLTVTIVGYETRCACSFEKSWMRGDHVDDVENELSMWIDELEAFLAAMELVES